MWYQNICSKRSFVLSQRTRATDGQNYDTQHCCKNSDKWIYKQSDNAALVITVRSLEQLIYILQLEQMHTIISISTSSL